MKAMFSEDGGGRCKVGFEMLEGKDGFVEELIDGGCKVRMVFGCTSLEGGREPLGDFALS